MKNFFLILLLFIFVTSCSKKEIKETVIYEKSLNSQVLEAYQEGMRALEILLL